MNPSSQGNKNTRFLQRPEVFNYSNAKSNDSDYQDLLNSPPSQIKREKQERVRAKNFEKLNKESKSSHKSLQKTEERHVPLLDNIVEDPETQLAKLQLQQYQKQRAEQIRQEEQKQKRKIHNQNRGVEQVERKNENVLGQLLKIRNSISNSINKESLFVSIQQLSEVKQEPISFVKENSNTKKNLFEEQKVQSIRKNEEIPHTENKRFETSRVTMNRKQILKMLQPQQQRQVPKRSARGSFKLLGRITMDAKSIADLANSNYNKNEGSIHQNGQHNIKRSRESLQYQSINYTDNFISGIIDRKRPRQEKIAKYKEEILQWQTKLEKNTKNLKILEQKNEQFKYYDLESHIDEEQFLNLKDLAEIMEPIYYFEYKYQIILLKFEGGKENNLLYAEFSLDTDIYCKIKREKESLNADIRVSYSSLLDECPREWIILAKQRVELLKLYFAYSLKNYNGYEIIKGIGRYYQKLQEFQYSFSQIANLFNLTQLQMNNNNEKLSFRFVLKPEYTFIVTIYLLKLQEPNYFDFYHLQQQKEIRFLNAVPYEDFYEVLCQLIDLLNENK